MQSLEDQIWRSRLAISMKLKLYNTCILPIYSCMVRTAGRYLRQTHVRSMHSTSGVCICCWASNGTNLSRTLRFDIHVNGILKLCSQRIYLLKLLRDKDFPCRLLNTVFDAIVLSKLRYAISVYHGFLSAELKGQINAFLKRVHTIDVIAEEADRSLFAKMAGSQHCLHTLLPDIKPYSYRLKTKRTRLQTT